MIMLAITAEDHEHRTDYRIFNDMIRDFPDVELHDSVIDLSEPELNFGDI